MFILKKKGKTIQYYEEEINKNNLQHIPRSISKIIVKKSIEQELEYS